MKTITLTQPWATLVAIGAKKIETRGWKTDHRGLLAIHAGSSLKPVGGMERLKKLIETEPFRSALKGHELPLGCIVAVVDLVEVKPTMHIKSLGKREKAFGDFSPGRYGWMLSNVRAISPLFIPGKLSLWESGYWWCSTCGNLVWSGEVTSDEQHDPRFGGCGGSVQ